MAATSVFAPVEGVLAGPRHADFPSVFREHYRFVRVTLRRLGVYDSELDDVTQDVFVIVHRKLGEFDATRPIQLWLFGICLRVASTHRRSVRHRLRRIADGPADKAAEGPLPDDELAAEESRRLVLAALDHIASSRRAVFVMYDLNEFSVNEIAEVLAINVNTVYSRLRVAREEFRQAVTKLRALRGSR